MLMIGSIDECLDRIKAINENNRLRIECLEKENQFLREKYNKDEEVKKMQQELDIMKKDLRRGFPISEREQKAIKEWQEKHDTEVHGLKTLEDRLHAGGLIGGRYTYHFVPTSIGISGTIQCSCGEEFEFCKL